MKTLSTLLLLCGLGISAYGQACKSAVVKNANDARAKSWNCSMAAAACTAKQDIPVRRAKKGEHYICSDNVPNPGPLTGYHVVLFTSGCPDCPVGWLYVKGEHCSDDDLNCMD